MREVSENAGDYPLLVRATIFRPVSVLVLGIAFVVVGVIAYPRIPLQLMPDGLSSGSCNIYIPVPDSTPREVMEEVVKPTEDYLRTIPGLKRIVSSSGVRRCNIHLEFAPEADVDTLVTEVRDRLDRAKGSWPPGTDRYWLWRHHAADMPVYIAAVSLGVDETVVDVDYLFDNVIKTRLEAVDGVARVNIWGIMDRRVEVKLDPNRLDAYGVPLDDLVSRLSGDNRTAQAGTVWEGDRELLVRVDGKFRDFREVEAFPIGNFTIGDFANVGYGTTVRDRMSRVNGHRSRVIAINKESTANAVEVCRRIAAGLEDIEANLRRTLKGAHIQAHCWMNQGELITYSIASLEESGLWGAFFAVVVLYAFFRRMGETFLVTLAIPFSLLITIVWMFFRGQSFNMLSLMGLTLGVGMLVDNSIVVVENILRKREEGHTPRGAAIHGTREVGLAITLATLTTIIVFLPGIFIGDPMIRGFFRTLGEPVTISVVASLLVALVFIPQGAIHLHRPSRSPAGPSPAPAAPRGYSWFNRACARGAGWCLENRLEATLIAFGVFAFGQTIYQKVPKSDMPPEGSQQRLEIDLKLPQNSTLQQADEAFAAVEKVILDRKEELQIGSVTCWFSAREGEVNIFPKKGVRLKEKDFFAKVRPLLPRLPGVTFRLGFEDFTRDSGGERLRVFVRGNDLTRLEDIGELVRAELENPRVFPELSEINRWKEDDVEEVRISVGRRLAQEYGTDTANVSRMVAWALRGAVLPDFEIEDREYPFWIRYRDADKERIDELNAVRIFRPGAEPVRLENLASYRRVPGSGEIHRMNGKMTVGYSASIRGDSRAVREKVQRHFSRFPLPEGFEVTLRQEERGFEQDFKNVLFALALAMLLVFFVMGILFESFILPLSVLFSIPHAFFGSVVLLWILQTPLDMVGMLGFLMLVGIVVNNAIVLVDCINRLRREEGLGCKEASVQAVQIRFRPIWMTALTTIFGLVPLLVFPQTGEGVDYKPLAVVLVGGLTTSTFFTLFVVPLFYSFLDDLREWSLRLFRLDEPRLRAVARGGFGAREGLSPAERNSPAANNSPTS